MRRNGGSNARLAGLVFASADVGVELDAQGRVTWALGAVSQFTGLDEASIVGRLWSDFLLEADGDLLTALLADLQPGQRKGPFAMQMRSPERDPMPINLSLFRMEASTSQVSCIVNLARSVVPPQRPGAHGGRLAEAEFSAAIEQLLAETPESRPLSLDLIELPGLDAAVQSLDDAAETRIRRRVASVLRARSLNGAAAAQIADDRFALVRTAGGSQDNLAGRLAEAIGAPIQPLIAELPMGMGTAQNLRAMRYALDCYIKNGQDAAVDGFKQAMERTVRETVEFKAAFDAGEFRLAYQPVVNLRLQQLHHFEALARFKGDESPTDSIRLAEELDLITGFDMAIAATVTRVLAAAPPGLKIAVNLSAVSLMAPGFVEALQQLTAAHAQVRARMILEVTETHALNDLPAAAKIVSDLRRLGHLVCLDDFGAGAASLDYLRHLDFDFIKIDGRYIQALATQSRDAMLLKHIVAICRDLGVASIAEMVETSEAAQIVEQLGVDFGQGWYFGKPLDQPALTLEVPNWRADPKARADS